jgi:hypothetical protein
MPTFAGVHQPRPSRIRRAWRTASPYVAYTFVATAATAALYSGNFRGLPLAQEVQTGVRTLVAYTMQHSRHANERETVVAYGPNPDATTSMLSPRQRTASETLNRISSLTPAGTYTEHFASSMRNQFASARAAIRAIARTADGTYPQPAELSGATIATIILKPTDAETRLGFEQDSLGTALASAAKLDSLHPPPNTPADQFTLEGHRYRTYRVQLPTDRVNTLVQSLSRYQVPADDTVLHALTSQGRMQFVTERGKVAFFSSRTDNLKDAMRQTIGSNSGQSGRAVQVVIVE